MGFLRRTPGNAQPKPGVRARMRSLYEQRFKREDPSGKEVALVEGEPILVVVKGRPVGVRAKNGNVIKFPEPPVEEWLRSDWGPRDHEDDWIKLPRRWWLR